ncbi:galactose oxidase [Gigaspora margarita]|uniref:Galactose oxidase n=1 Tax=Gigaspora margarita TaxID=4874 RepID=A0A8H3X9S4_GIGMA|nr:galactose oxidase [Gigaspora margarita]
MYYNDMNIFDITTMFWSTLIIPQAPKLFSYTAILLPTGLIIYIGGVDYNISSGKSLMNMNTIDGLPVFSHLAVLNTSTWAWSIPDISLSNTPNPLTFHSQHFIKITWLLHLEEYLHQEVFFNKDVYVLDIQKYVWIGVNNPVTTSQGSPSSQTTQTNNTQKLSNPSSNNGMLIGIGVVCGIMVIGIVSLIGFLLFKR